MPDSALAPAAAVSNAEPEAVSELAQRIKGNLERDFSRVRVRGELGRVTIAKSGHLYADLKDANACISLVMWKGNFAALKGFRPEEGLEIIAEGRVSTFPGKSQYQLIAERMEPAGAGALLAQLERVKERLRLEGLFAQERKKPIPFLPRTIGVVTSPTGAVIRDILHRLEERFPRRVLLWPVQVQGLGAKEQIAAAIEGFNRLEEASRPDVLIVARGGGSIEDLWAFNEEIVVRAAAASRIPLISAVGHETDTTLIDFASDRRAPTPTAAAEMAVPVRAELLARVEDCGARLISGLSGRLERRRADLRAASARLPRADALFALPSQRLDRASERLDQALRGAAQRAETRFARLSARLRPEALAQDLGRREGRLTELGARLVRGPVAAARAGADRFGAVAGRLRPQAVGLEARAAALAAAGRLLETLSHRNVLARGFALVTRPDGALARSAAGISSGDPLILTFQDGTADVVAVGSGPGAKRKPRRDGGGGDAQGDLF